MKPVVWLFLVFGAGGGVGGLAYYREQANHRASEARALSIMRKWMTAQDVFAMEQNGYSGSLDRLLDQGHFSIAPSASHHEDGWSFAGYRFTMFGGMSQCGLSAFPDGTGAGEMAFLALIDPEYRKVTDSTENHVRTEGGDLVFSAPVTQVGGRVTDWPSKEQLAELWELRTMSVEDGMKKAKETYEQGMQEIEAARQEYEQGR